jgi:D-glycero-beta-D-manno-heptose-7-phosphate kinase
LVTADISALFTSFQSLTVLVVGDVMIDAYLWGQASRISPEAPVPIVNVVRRERRLGGAANVALNVQALGATPLLCSVVGDDVGGSDLRRLMAEAGLPTDGIVSSAERPTTVKERILASDQQLLRIDSEVETPLSDAEMQLVEARYAELLARADVVIFEDYDKGVLTAQNIPRLIAMARAQGIPTAVDPKKKNFLSYVGCTLFKPNLKELKEGVKIDFAGFQRPAFERAVAELQRQLSPEIVLVTLSERGVFVQPAAAAPTYLPAHERAIVDVSGAGDTVISIAALCLARQLPADAIAALANLGGGLVCERVGVVPIDKALLLTEAQEKIGNSKLPKSPKP